MHKLLRPYTKVDFSNKNGYTPAPFKVDLEVAADTKRLSELVTIIRNRYGEANSDDDVERRRQLIATAESYRTMFDAAIRAGNISGIEAMWDGTWYHLLDRPDYTDHLHMALRFGSLETVMHVMYNRFIHPPLGELTPHGIVAKEESMIYSKLLDLATWNQDLRVFVLIEDLAQYVEGDILFTLPRYADDNIESHAKAQKIWATMEKHV